MLDAGENVLPSIGPENPLLDPMNFIIGKSTTENNLHPQHFVSVKIPFKSATEPDQGLYGDLAHQQWSRVV
jgi:hypothetical protein